MICKDNKSTPTTPRPQASRSQKPGGCWCSTRQSSTRQSAIGHLCTGGLFCPRARRKFNVEFLFYFLDECTAAHSEVVVAVVVGFSRTG